jgi:CRP/FNR family transcriptional regulator, cyclic AMP receptor protein
MILTKDVEVLRSIPLFAKLEPAKLKLLAFTSERLQYLSGDAVFLDGKADILVDSPKGAIKIETLGKNIVGEIAILCDVPRTATVVAHCDLEILRLSKDGFFHLITHFPQFGIEVMREVAARLHHTTQALTAERRDR